MTRTAMRRTQLAFLAGLDVRELQPEMIEPDTIEDDGGPVIH